MSHDRQKPKGCIRVLNVIDDDDARVPTLTSCVRDSGRYFFNAFGRQRRHVKPGPAVAAGLQPSKILYFTFQFFFVVSIISPRLSGVTIR